MSDGTLHLIGHAHIDPVWLWQWPEGYQEIKATFRSALDRTDEDPEFVFTASSAAFYEWVQRNEPEMFDEIRQRVADGRWRVVGGWWCEPDCNVPNGESFVRQALVGQRWFHEHLGVIATVGFNPDSFGHHAMLPQILAKSRLDSYVFMRPGDHELGLPARTFWWESDDGSRVLTYRIPYEYLTWGKEIDAHVARCAAEIKPPQSHIMCFYGVGNHGGGPTRENIESIHRLREKDDLPELAFSDPDRFFAAVRASGVAVPVVHTELQNHARGCYSAHAGIKLWNRRAERLLLTAERIGTIAARVTDFRPTQDLQRAWKNVLFNQFHDILPGTAIEPAYTDARDELGESAAIAGRAIQDGLQSISWNIDIPQQDGTIPVVVFNPHSWRARVPVELETGKLPEAAVVLDDDGVAQPVQSVQSLATVEGGRARICFLADLPPLGYRTYLVVPGEGHTVADPNLHTTDLSLDNGRLRLEFEPGVGLTRVHDQRHDVEVVAPGFLRAEVLRDESDTWSHGVVAYTDTLDHFEVTRVQLVESGPVRAVMRIHASHGTSQLVQDVILYDDLDYVDVRATVDWHEQFRVLKLRFPVAMQSPKATFEIPFGTIERATEGQEVPGQRWADLSGRVRGVGSIYGLTVANDAKHGFDVRGNDLGVTILRSPIYAHHDPKVPSADEKYAFHDQGPHDFALRLVPHAGGWVEADAVRRAAELDLPVVPLMESPHPGPLPQSDSFVDVDVRNVVVSALKEAEDGGAAVLRCYETAGRQTDAVITLDRWQRTIETGFGPNEIKTFRLPDDAAELVTEVDLLEWDPQQPPPGAAA
ncbi:alpha-mannosidase [Egicoccus sp. AB-alg6-2]|uniref:alpha-mannosidase n=1 Tax=Egicoccus sp. AB-alg6-2 TaxID=3242692 RepID=UPI00359F0BB8